MLSAERAPLVVVLGASGFLGSAVAGELSGMPVRLRLVSRREVRAPSGAAEIESRRADLSRPGALAEVVRGADVVFPFAAQIRGVSGWRLSAADVEAERTNVGVIRELVAGLRGGVATTPPVVVFPGSNTQVGPVGAERIDGSEPDHPEGVYDTQKLTAERILKEATAAGDVRATSLRLPPLFGPPSPTAQDRGIVSTMIRRALAGEPLTMWHDGTVRRDLLPVRDAARAFVDGALHADGLSGRHFLLGTGCGRPLGDVFRAIALAVAAHTGADPVPVVSVAPPEHAEDSDFRSLDVDASGFTAITGWSCRTTLEDALPGMVAALEPGP